MSQDFLNVWVEESNIPEKYRITKPYSILEYLCNGQFVSFSGNTSKVYSPVHVIQKDGNVARQYVGEFPVMEAPELLSCLEAAVKAYNYGSGLWPTLPIVDRIKAVEKFTIELIKRKEEIVKLIIWEICKNEKWSYEEFDRTIRYIQDTIDAMKELDRSSSRFQIVEGIIAQIRRAPLGVSLVLGPFSYPLYESLSLVIPALLTGNTVLVKPPKVGTLLFKPVSEAFKNSFPAGVVNIIYGRGSHIIPPIIKTGKVDVLAFIGTAPRANLIRISHPHPHRLRCILGLEAKNPAIVCADADIDQAANECVLGAFSFNGQRRTTLKIIFVYKNISGKLLDKMAKITDDLVVSVPWDERHPFVTPLPEENKVKDMQAYVDDAVAKGANIINKKGGKHNETIFFPTIIFPCKKGMKLYTEEQFGPIMPVVEFTDIKEPIEYIRSSNYGQQCSIFSTKSDQITRLIDPLANQLCRVNINSQCQRGPDKYPYTGRKDSAEQTMSTEDTLRSFTIRTLVATKQNPQNIKIFQEILHDRKSNFLSTDFIL